MEPVRLLLVEDNPGDVRLIQHVLEGYPRPITMEVAANDDEALQKLSLAAREADLVLVDLSIPGVCSGGFFERLSSRKVAWVVFSSTVDPKERDSLVARGAREYIQKPSDLSAFALAVFDILDRWAPGGSDRVSGTC